MDCVLSPLTTANRIWTFQTLLFAIGIITTDLHIEAENARAAIANAPIAVESIRLLPSGATRPSSTRFMNVRWKSEIRLQCAFRCWAWDLSAPQFHVGKAARAAKAVGRGHWAIWMK